MVRPAPPVTSLAVAFVLAVAAAPAAFAAPATQPAAAGGAGQVWWGKPAGGVRVGLACATPATPSDRPPRFKVVLENVSAEPVRLPSVTTYVERPPAGPGDGAAAGGAGASGKPMLARPLQPVIDLVAGQAALSVGTGGDESAGLPADSITLDPGKSVAFDDLPLDAFSYVPGRTDYGTQTTRQTSWLMPASTYWVRFAFENGQAEVGGRKVWTGRAVSDAVFVRVDPPAFDAGTLPGEFVAEKANGFKPEYFVGEPVFVTFRVTNRGKDPVWFPDGGDYRSTGRHDRFTVTAWDAAGRRVPDPVKASGAGGGLGGDRTIRPGETHTDALLANLWCAFTEPGQYTVECGRSVTVRTVDGYAPEQVLPAVPIATRLTITVRRDEAALARYLKDLPGRLEDRGEDDVARGLPNGTTAMRARDELRALALAQNGPAFDVIAGVARRPGTFRADAVQWLEAYGKDKAGPVLLELAKAAPDGGAAAAGDENVRRTALDALVRLGADGVGPVLLDALSAADAGVRAAAVLDCSRAKPPACFDKLMAMADDPDPIVRRYLGATLAAYGDPKAVPVLLKLLDDRDADRFIRIWAADGLGKLGRKDGVPVLIELLRDPKAAGYRGNVVYGLTALTGQNLPDEYEPWKRWWDAEGRGK